MSERWRGVMAALLNPDLRQVLAEAMTATDAAAVLPAARRARAAGRLADLGLVRIDDAGAVRFDEGGIRRVLDEAPIAKPTGPARYLDADGRIDRYPVRDADRRELLAWIAARAFRPEDVLTERAVNERLAQFTDDVAALRRYLVDAGLLERTRSGTEYAPVIERA
ncbi:DUF2087 domain-containing protein [Microbacterium sp. 2FI]|uniref:DUF2087 domain-containing protein n=1 Tax=Microbacterium sp. 2FI TaxID=2502193 RepID=UPI002015E8D5|nr:DUF2087 domain-containing protein [Microbacterium sp. 2FI]